MVKFSWDPAKARSNLKKHGVSFEEAKSVFYDEFALQFYDDETSEEDRFLLLGGLDDPTLVWVSVWDDAAARDRFVSTLGPGLPGDRETAFMPIEVGGRPGALLRVGPEVGPIQVELAGP